MWTRLILLLTLLFLTALPGIHKILGDLPPDWFVGMFEKSIIGKIPAGLEISFVIIVLLELGAGVLFLLALLRKEFTADSLVRFTRYGLLVTQLLFLILFFGSFLIENYDNGFKDFMYLVGVILIERFFFAEKKSADG